MSHLGQFCMIHPAFLVCDVTAVVWMQREGGEGLAAG